MWTLPNHICVKYYKDFSDRDDSHFTQSSTLESYLRYYTLIGMVIIMVSQRMGRSHSLSTFLLIFDVCKRAILIKQISIIICFINFQLEEELRQSNVTTSEPQNRRRKESHVSPDTLQKWLAKQVLKIIILISKSSRRIEK